jgi:hypothetical protein
VNLIFTADGSEAGYGGHFLVAHERIGGGSAEAGGGCESRPGPTEGNLWTTPDNHGVHHRNNFMDVVLHEMIKTL